MIRNIITLGIGASPGKVYWLLTGGIGHPARRQAGYHFKGIYDRAMDNSTKIYNRLSGRRRRRGR